MAAGTTSLCSSLLFAAVFVLVSTDEIIITAKAGQDVTLPCRAPNSNILVVKWNRTDLKDEYVLLYQDGHTDSEKQLESFKNRVDLQDRQLKDGDVSVILKNVTAADNGTYQCCVVQKAKGPFSTFSLINLIVLPEQKPITAEPGQNVPLTCRAPNNNNIGAVEWSRADLEAKNIFFYQDGHFVPDNQHPSFKNRVDLQDRQMKDGDVSVILKDVTAADEGTYVCRVRMEGAQSWKTINITYLRVLPGHPGGSMDGWVLPLVLVAVGVAVVVGVVIRVHVNGGVGGCVCSVCKKFTKQKEGL